MYGNGLFNPYMYQPYQAANLARGIGNLGNISSAASSNIGASGIKSLLGKFSFGGFLDGASKTLNVVNQAIPIFYQVKPMFNNAKTMFRILGAVKQDGSSSNTNNSYGNSNIDTATNTVKTDTNSSYVNINDDNNVENPTFFI